MQQAMTDTAKMRDMLQNQMVQLGAQKSEFGDKITKLRADREVRR